MRIPASPDTPEGAARLAYEALRDNSYAKLRALSPRAGDLRWFLDTVVENDPIKSEMVVKFVEEKGGPGKVAEETEEKLRKEFERERAQAAEVFDWGSSKFGGLTDWKQKEDMGVIGGDIKFLIKAGGKSYVFQLEECVKCPRGWVVTDGIDFRGP